MRELGFAVLAIVAVAGMTPAGTFQLEKVEVELDIFSGRPNPNWILGDADAAFLARRIASLPRSETRNVSGRLGYRGFVVQAVQRGRQMQLQVQQRTVRVSGDGEVAHYRDDDRSLERWLLDSGKGAIDAELLALVEEDWNR